MSREQFVNRELSWLEFNRRVLEEAQDPSVPLLERVKFLAILSANLDEFFMIRMAHLKRQVHAGETAAGPDGLTPAEALAAVSARVHALVEEQHRCFLDELQPLLALEGVSLLRAKDVTPEQERFLETYFRQTLLPVVTPLAIDPGHPFPHLGNRERIRVISIVDRYLEHTQVFYFMDNGTPTSTIGWRSPSPSSPRLYELAAAVRPAG